MARAILLLLLFLNISYADGTCSIHPWTMKMHITGYGHDGRQFSYDMTWLHITTQVDSFLVKDSQNGSTILNLWLDTEGLHLYQFGVERKLARHHLQESIGNSALILDDLIRMRDKYTPCDTTRPELQKWFPGPRKAQRIVLSKGSLNTYQQIPSFIEMTDRWGRKVVLELEPTDTPIPSHANQEMLSQTKLGVTVTPQEDTSLD